MAVLAPLEGHPELLATLVTYFEIGMNTSATARRMHLHKNSLRYRLLRIEELLDRDLHHSVDVAVITTALAIKDRSSGRSGQRTD
jgi:DNA-binding PucR family transcriptional regulator